MYRDIEELPIKRRAYERHEVAVPMQYRTFLGAGSPSKGALTGTLTVDISGGGLCIVSEEFIPVSSRVVVHMAGSSGDAPIERLCQVAWVRLLPHSERYEVGLRLAK